MTDGLSWEHARVNDSGALPLRTWGPRHCIKVHWYLYPQHPPFIVVYGDHNPVRFWSDIMTRNYGLEQTLPDPGISVLSRNQNIRICHGLIPIGEGYNHLLGRSEGRDVIFLCSYNHILLKRGIKVIFWHDGCKLPQRGNSAGWYVSVRICRLLVSSTVRNFEAI